jgi:cytochrome c oxidase cbb3-type subunit 2
MNFLPGFRTAMSHRPRHLMSAMVAAVLLAGTATAAEPPAPDPAAGQAAYAQHCARCHGVQGKGDGVDAKRFYPRPRDFTLGVYKFRSTVSGTPPTDADLYRSVDHGLPGTNMPDWQHLDEATRWQIVYYLKSLSPVFTQTPPAPVQVSADPGKAADRAKGRALYEQLGCAACHGPAGRANGTSAAGLVDDWGMPVRPADLTQGWTYRGGADAHSIMMRFLTGIDGAGMPSYAETISPEDAWHLAYYVTSLQEPVFWHAVAHPSRAQGALPSAADDPQWERAEQTDVPLRNAVTPAGEWAQPGTVRAVAFRTVYNEESVVFRFTWDDPTQSGGETPDRLILLLKPEGSQGDIVTLQAWPYEGGPALDLCAWSSAGGITETVGDSYDPALEPGGAALDGAATYQDGRWQLVLRRPRIPTAPEGAAAITGDRFTSMAVAVWDGDNPGARAVSPWVELAIEDGTKSSHH